MPTPLQRLLRISPQQLRAFAAAARLQSVTQAARTLHVSQPTVSVQLKQLSELVGEPLFEPMGRGVRLTRAGEALQDTVKEINDSWQNFENRLTELRALLRGRLKLAAVTTAEYFVPDLLGPFGDMHPGIDIELAVENRDRVIARLHQRVDDLAVMMLPPDDLPLESLPFMNNPLTVIVPRGHRLSAMHRPVSLQELAGERWLMREQGSGTRWVTEQHFASLGFRPRIVMSLGSNEALKHAVGAGFGIAVISRLAIEHQPDAPWVALPVEGFPVTRPWLLVWRTDTPLAAPARQFVSYLQNRERHPVPRVARQGAAPVTDQARPL